MTPKICSICKENKSLSSFNKNANKIDGLQTHCRKCSKEKFSTYYNSNKDKHRTATVLRNKIHKTEILQFVYDYLKEHSCVDCGNTNPLCLEFDHVRGIKSMAISSMLRNNFSIPKIKLEIEKCDVRCANCHRIKTAKDQNWYGVVNK